MTYICKVELEKYLELLTYGGYTKTEILICLKRLIKRIKENEEISCTDCKH